MSNVLKILFLPVTYVSVLGMLLQAVMLQQWPRVSGGWQSLHTDFAEDPNTRQQILVLVDIFSKWLEFFIIKSASSMKTIEKL